VSGPARATESIDEPTMTIVLFSDAPENFAGPRNRLIKFAQLLTRDGHRCVICLPFGHRTRARWYENRSRPIKLIYLILVFLLRFWQLRHVPGADAVFIRRHVFPFGPPFFERLIRMLNPRTVLDIDDALWAPAGYVDSPFLSLVDYDWTRKVCSFAAHVIAGNRYIEAYTRQFNPNVTIIPTCVDMETHTAKTYRTKGTAEPVILGWTGLYSNLGYFEVIEDVLRDLSRRHSIALMIASTREFVLEGVNVINRHWVLEHEVDYLQEPDIGLMPLTESERAKGKCAYKALEFMSVGTPCVISPVGMNAEVIENGVNGFLAATPAEWMEKLERLIVDADLRRSMGQAARATIQERYSHDVHYPTFKGVMEQVAATRRALP
jgi:glycosyltransferase involved in cell wall biosynthesis